MLFRYTVEMGAPNKNRIVPDGDSLRCEFNGDGLECWEQFFVMNFNSEISLGFSVEDGYLIGAHSGRLILRLRPQTEIKIPDYIDGRLHAQSEEGVILGGCDYLDIRNDDILYDGVNKIIAFGDPSEASITVRTCANLFVSLGEGGNIVAVFVKL